MRDATRQNYLQSGTAVVRTAAAIWLLSLVKYSGNHPVIKAHLHDITTGFSLCLGDTEGATDFTIFEMSRGFSLADAFLRGYAGDRFTRIGSGLRARRRGDEEGARGDAHADDVCGQEDLQEDSRYCVLHFPSISHLVSSDIWLLLQSTLYS